MVIYKSQVVLSVKKQLLFNIFTGDGKLQVDELLDNIHIINTHIQHREDLMAAFKVFDRKGEGYIRHVYMYGIVYIL